MLIAHPKVGTTNKWATQHLFLFKKKVDVKIYLRSNNEVVY